MAWRLFAYVHVHVHVDDHAHVSGRLQPRTRLSVGNEPTGFSRQPFREVSGGDIVQLQVEVHVDVHVQLC